MEACLCCLSEWRNRICFYPGSYAQVTVGTPTCSRKRILWQKRLNESRNEKSDVKQRTTKIRDEHSFCQHGGVQLTQTSCLLSSELIWQWNKCTVDCDKCLGTLIRQAQMWTHSSLSVKGKESIVFVNTFYSPVCLLTFLLSAAFTAFWPISL